MKNNGRGQGQQLQLELEDVLLGIIGKGLGDVAHLQGSALVGDVGLLEVPRAVAAVHDQGVEDGAHLEGALLGDVSLEIPSAVLDLQRQHVRQRAEGPPPGRRARILVRVNGRLRVAVRRHARRGRGLELLLALGRQRHALARPIHLLPPLHRREAREVLQRNEDAALHGCYVEARGAWEIPSRSRAKNPYKL
eukprot:CAMPEP_0118859588 /NCGR_PEP_ID=MMETSP1163-20130328/5774_1 /TAXON_ID=124430 /ORGANISM="Phaeomonas parva, Strain CCMP2877" /LENGTH=192 /DNA_ID=CAMNT_0006793201 /DNA_START=438 /DNA_END=1017 /DNA_ORIENTATION=+